MVQTIIIRAYKNKYINKVYSSNENQKCVYINADKTKYITIDYNKITIIMLNIANGKL